MATLVPYQQSFSQGEHRLKRSFRQAYPEVFKFLRDLWRWPQRLAVSESLNIIQKFQDLPVETLTDQRFLEDFIPRLGLHPSGGFGTDEYEWPPSLTAYTGKGLQIWQYPNQFSKYLAFLSAYKINSYLEIGVAYGGTFVLTLEYLGRLNTDCLACCVDVRSPSALFDVYSGLRRFTYVVSKSCDLFNHVDSGSRFDLVFIDGDHSKDGVINDFALVKDRASIIGFHDIVNFKTPGTIAAWLDIKSRFGDSFDFFEFVDQYPGLCGDGEGKSLLGIGVAVKKGVQPLAKV